MSYSEEHGAMQVIDLQGLESLFATLKAQGFTLIGPKVCDQAIVYDEIHTTGDLPVGWADRQEPGAYRLERRGDGALFGYVVGPHSWKKYLFPPMQRLYQIERNGKQLKTSAEEPDTCKRAFIGVRACELAAMVVQDKVFMNGSFVDPHYRSRRGNVFIIAVNCGEPASTCFCVSMSTGPEATQGFDLALTEVIHNGSHEFVVQVGSELGATMLQPVGHRKANEQDKARHEMVVAGAAQRMSRSMQTSDLKELLYRNHQSPRWDEVANRCLSCANCTMVCPTCFCSTVEDVTDLRGDHAERWRKWDSCFTMDFSYLGGGSVRASTKSRYRQWMTHKLAAWQDQFGVNGCTGCGRCITWCPVGIDITEEVSAIRALEQSTKASMKELSNERV